MRIKKLIKKHDIKTNSKEIKKGDIFVCTLGNYDKTKYISDAKKKGSSLVITDDNYKEGEKVYKVHDINNYLREILDYKYDYPLENKTLIGITGTDGKTTTASIIRDLLNGASIGTNGLEWEEFSQELHNTTPSLDTLFKCFNLINKEKINNIVMEVSSESYLTKRIPTLKFDVGVFLNISEEHLDKHKDFDNYLLCKKELLQNSKIKIINKDSPYFNKIVSGLENYLTYGHAKSDLEILKYKLSFDKTIIKFKYLGKIYHITSPYLGKYNVDNLMASILVLLSLNYDINNIIGRINNLQTIKGRMEKITRNGKNIFIDYAHTLNATNEILKFLHKYSHKNLITVIGCAGDRYKEKRPLIGKIALKYSKIVIFTKDDPRGEDVNEIINEMLSKTKKKNYFSVISRKNAIFMAINMAKENDLVVILGKGRDNYMAIGDKHILYSDIYTINEYFTYQDM